MFYGYAYAGYAGFVILISFMPKKVAQSLL